jgi:hypothetical protein
MQRAVCPNYSYITLYRPSLKRYNQAAGEITLPNKGVDRPGFVNVQRNQIWTTAGTTKLEEVEQQVDWMRQDVEKLEIGCEWHPTAGGAAYWSKGKIAFYMRNTAE